MLALVLALLAWSPAFAQFDPLTSPWYVKVPGVTGMYTSTAASSFGNSVDAAGVTVPKQVGFEAQMLMSLSGLAAKAALAGTNSELIWANLQNFSTTYGRARQDLLTRRGLQDLGIKSPWQLVDIFKAKGIVQGYVVYRYDTGSRVPFNGGTFDASINVATVYAHQLNAIMIEQSQITAAQSRGLTQLADCRGMTQEQAWTAYQASVNKKFVLTMDPKLPWNRDYAIGVGCFALFPLDPAAPTLMTSFYRNTVLPAMSEPFAVLGWPGGDEFNHTDAASVQGGFNTATAYACNLLLHGLLTPGVHDAAANYRINTQGGVDLTRLAWTKRDVHYTAIVMSDGDNFDLMNTFVDDELNNVGEYFGHPARGQLPFTWGAAVADLYQTMPTTERLLGSLSTPNDQFIQAGAGYFYPDRFPNLVDHVARMRPLLASSGVFTWLGLFEDLSSPAAAAALNTIASSLAHPAGLFTLQYYPYNGGQGQISWHANERGWLVPALAAKYAIWSNSNRLNEGTGTEVAALINAAPASGPPNQPSYFDWTVVHIWSLFDDCADTAATSASPAAGIERAYASAKCLAEGLAPHVKLVTAEELAWHAALHLRTADALQRVYDIVDEETTQSLASGSARAVMQRHTTQGRAELEATTGSLATVLLLDSGDARLAAYGTPTDPSMQVSVNSSLQMVDGTPSTRFSMGSTFAFSNMEFATQSVTTGQRTLEFDIHGDGSGAVVRLELYSTALGAFVYHDVTLNFTGWRHVSLRLDGSNGLLAHNATHAQVLNNFTIFQVSGPWNAIATTFHLDNVRISEASLATRLSVDEAYKYEQFLKAQDRLKAVRGTYPFAGFQEGFEAFANDALPQGGWLDVTGAPTLTTARAHGGTHALRLATGDAVEKLVYQPRVGRLRVQGWVYLDQWSTAASKLELGAGLCTLIFRESGIDVLHGNGAGGTTTLRLAGPFSPAAWHLVNLNLDFNNGTFDLALNQATLATALPFVEPATEALLSLRMTGPADWDDLLVLPDASGSRPAWAWYDRSDGKEGAHHGTP